MKVNYKGKLYKVYDRKKTNLDGYAIYPYGVQRKKNKIEKIWIKNLSVKKKNQIKKKLQEDNYLPFYKKSGTSIFTRRIPRDFEELYYKKEEMKLYLN